MPGMPGIPGSQGPQGRDGEKGQTGDQGSQGTMGPKGERGIEGPRGKNGPPGMMGIKGARGLVGDQGIKGDKGEKGESLTSPSSAVPQTNWKQCVWKSEDGKDSGKIKKFISAHGFPGIPGSNGMPGMPGIPGSQGSQGRDGAKGQIGDKGSQGTMGPKGEGGIEGPRGKNGPPGMMGIKGARGLVGDQGIKGDKGEKGESLTSPSSAVPQTNWKQCVWKSNDGKDSGKIKDCSFNKLQSDTAIKVSFQGNMRVYGSSTKCNRWFFKFNGNECSGPMTIEAVVYNNWPSSAGNPNLLHHRSFEGYCENIPQGTVRVELWVGQCPSGNTLGDAYTGWESVSRIMIEEDNMSRPQS
ncbi:uncharacterized protein LOC144638637 isoform X3 [Oculina patagonica]